MPDPRMLRHRATLLFRDTSGKLGCLMLRVACCALPFLLITNPFSLAQEQSRATSNFPCPEKLSYRIEWRMMTAGTATVEMTHITRGDWETKLNLESAGLVTRLYKVLDSYKVTSSEKFCASSAFLDAQEGKRHTITRLTFENARRKVAYDEQDLLKNASVKKELDIAPCTYDIAGALQVLRLSNLPLGKSSTIPVTDGKKMAYAKVEAQAKEAVSVQGKTYQTVRYEAFLFDNVLYKRKGRMQIWISEDPDRVPVQLRLQFGFPIGSITVQLQSSQKT